jgi:hypothetical protein
LAPLYPRTTEPNPLLETIEYQEIKKKTGLFFYLSPIPIYQICSSLLEHCILLSRLQNIDYALFCSSCSSLPAFDFPKIKIKNKKKTFFSIFTTQFTLNITPCITVVAPQAWPQLHDASNTLNDFFQHHILPLEIRNAWA